VAVPDNDLEAVIESEAPTVWELVALFDLDAVIVADGDFVLVLDGVAETGHRFTSAK
jgi:hypothetical protein